MPPVGNQGQQGSCTAWAIGYYQKTHYEYLEHHWNDSTTSHEFSPAFIYNQIDGGADYGLGLLRCLLADCRPGLRYAWPTAPTTITTARRGRPNRPMPTPYRTAAALPTGSR